MIINNLFGISNEFISILNYLAIILKKIDNNLYFMYICSCELHLFWGEIFEKIKLAIWDLDNTLYSFPENFPELFNKASANAVLEIKPDIGLNISELTALAEESFRKYHNSLTLFAKEYGIDYAKLHKIYHEKIDPSFIKRDEELIKAFAKTTGIQHWVLSHGSTDWCNLTLEKIGISQFFSKKRVVGHEQYSFLQKINSVDPFSYIIKLTGLSAENILFVEDSHANIVLPKELGIITVLLSQDQGPNNNHACHVFGKAPEVLSELSRYNEERVSKRLGFSNNVKASRLKNFNKFGSAGLSV